MKKAIILDDEQSAINMLESYLDYFDFIDLLGSYTTMEEAEKVIIQSKPDLLFLDIQIHGDYVFTMLERLKGKNLQFAIIFITAYYEKHLQNAINSCGFKYPFSYIGKPIDPSLLREYMEKYQLYTINKNQGVDLSKDSIVLKQNGGYIRIRYEEIIYCESDGNYSNIYMLSDNLLKRKNTQCSLLQLEKELPDSFFFRMSSKHLINAEFFDEVKIKGKIRECGLAHKTLIEKVFLPIPENKWKMFKDRFNL